MTARASAARIRAAVLAASAVTVLVLALGTPRQPYALERELWWIRGSGYAALTALFGALAATPLGRLGARLGRPAGAAWAAVRRQLGIAAASWAALHAAVAATTYLDGAWRAVVSWPYLRAGLVAVAILLLLLATSFPGLNRRLGVRWWKPLHRLAYAAAFFVALHLALSPFAPRRRVAALFLGLLVIEALRFVPARREAGAGAG